MKLSIEGIEKEVEFSSIRSRGPGGQHVNKTSSAVQLHWDFQASSYLSAAQKELIQLRLKNSINKVGQIYIQSDEFRDLRRNKDNCLNKLKEKLQKALHKPKLRKKTKPTKASVKRTKEEKAKRSKTKTLRQKPVL